MKRLIILLPLISQIAFAFGGKAPEIPENLGASTSTASNSTSATLATSTSTVTMNAPNPAPFPLPIVPLVAPPPSPLIGVMHSCEILRYPSSGPDPAGPTSVDLLAGTNTYEFEIGLNFFVYDPAHPPVGLILFSEILTLRADISIYQDPRTALREDLRFQILHSPWMNFSNINNKSDFAFAAWIACGIGPLYH